MFFTSRDARKVALLGATAIAAVGAIAVPAQAAEVTLGYQCEFPFVGAQSVSAYVIADLPATATAGKPTGEFTTDVGLLPSKNVTVMAQIVGATNVSGQVNLSLTASPVSVLPIADTPVPQGPDAQITLTGSGQASSITFPQAGDASVNVEALSLTLALSDADGNPIVLDGGETFDAPCTVDAGSNTKLGSVAVGAAVGAPQVQLVVPRTLPARRVSNLTIYGTNIKNATSVTIGGVRVPSFRPAGFALEVKTPALPAGRYQVVVKTPGGTSATNDKTSVTYIR